jgi:transposase
MSSMTVDEPTRKVIVGVDTHKHIHVAVAIDHHGARLGDLIVPADSGGYGQLEAWARALGRIDRFGIEGTGSYGAGLTSFLRRCGHRVVECNREDRRARRRNGKSDSVDAEAAARSVLAGTSAIIPKTADGVVEMIRQVKIARDTARKGRTTAIITLKAMIVNAPAELRESLSGLPDRALLDRCAGFRPGPIIETTASTKHALRALAKRWGDLDDEIVDHDRLLDVLTAQASPTLRDGYGIGADTAAEMLIVFGDNPERIRSEAAFAKLCGACPIPASSGMTNKHRLYRGGHRQANAALYRTVIVRMRFHQPTIDYVARRTADGLSKKDIIRCLKRFLAREVYRRVITDHTTRTA